MLLCNTPPTVEEQLTISKCPNLDVAPLIQQVAATLWALGQSSCDILLHVILGLE